ncbi:MAG: 30S ribosomal protein S6 [Candidatus Uhrbacteria bacterium GW2011_GWD2_41_121]|uniref:Small ribosomal subunit protein bS6 n=1 Tax=Candidatus Uhrbacteria bacterium GW2011_GWC1_41_20 TaxID=1618983 RepID=A0A0G0XLF2_9BACT|nr:MAG: 30S ribosomal protein S6 [Candidatus Uhrbacteria bacterium GW2011_GWE1_39_46]KKR63338.1 MAG: 30S ribosomal protein S6 [Candidatus Uhrbacteria bacterium GW2011_GWC2_40_450]KKR89599.1 MAG: 30S ribosomal protein S6 [Candidatus Uhrbacteria bacterium GW2011_GWD2_41_121]KKR95090.1 MAG: 30S ribosomal protein S6 [Candidatus Uhrbacteria bacterium GW2011_GWD1_41_16]KKR97600.1 MAG: 30S ribosomal protein S6 [Candidatus Uhrbacteria bacterium GW2011_GWC1_41_20]KKS05405.1 MAG: 30S ribosomal protein S
MIYEILYIIPSKFSDSEIDGVTERVSNVLETAGAKVQETKNLGKIKLAYPVKKMRHGTYILTYVEHDGSNLQKIDQNLRLSEDVLRHVVVKRPEGIPTMSFTLTSYQEPLSPEGKRTTAKKEPRAKKSQAEPVAEKMTAMDLDKQLDDILDSDLTNI